MKKFRPYKAGYIVLYALGVACVGDAVVSIVSSLRGTQNEMLASMSMFTYLLAILAIFYVKMYVTTKVVINGSKFRFVNTAYIKPAEGAKRASFIYRQGENDIRRIDKTFNMEELERYGFIEDLGYSKLDRSGAGEGNALFPVHEVAFVMQDGKRYHFNAGNYSFKQLREMVTLIQSASHIAPEGKLALVLDESKWEQLKPKKEAKKGKGKGKK